VYAVGSDPGRPAAVTVIDPARDAVVAAVPLYDPGFRGGVAAAVGDVTGDGTPDVVTGAGPGGGPRVDVIDGATGTTVLSFFAYEDWFRGGVTVAVGDVDGDGVPEIVTGTGPGGGPRVRVFRVTAAAGRVTGAAVADDFFGYEADFRGGVNVAAGDVDGDDRAEVVLGTGVGGGPRVRAIDPATGAVRLDFFAYDDRFRGGVNVAAGDIDGDGVADIVTGPGAGGGPEVRAFAGRTGAAVADFPAFDPSTRGGVRVGTAGDAGGPAEVIAWDGRSVRRFDPAGRTLGEVALTAAAPPVTTPVDARELTPDEVSALLRRAAAASATTDGIIAVVDRNGRILGVRVEDGVAPDIQSNTDTLVFAVDGAVAKARTGAFFGNDESPLTSRTIQFISQSTVTQREVESDPNVTDPNSTVRGPGFVAPVGIKAHFPPDVPFTPPVDLFEIEHTNRDGTFTPGPDRIKGTADDVRLAERFDIDPAYIPSGAGGAGRPGNKKELFAPDSYGFASGLLPGAQSRGIATLPGGVPIVKNGQVVGGIGVFYPGKTGYATEENSALSTTFDPTKPDRSAEAEWVAVAAVGGVPGQIDVGALGGVPVPAGFGLPFGRVDLVGVTLDIFGPGGLQGPDRVNEVGRTVGRGDPNAGRNLAVDAAGDTLLAGLPVPDGWLVTPHDGNGITAAEVNTIITDALAEAQKVRAAIRLPVGTRAKFVYAVADRDGNVVGLYRQPDATIFSIDVAVAKARNVNYYADPAKLQPVDEADGAAPGTAFTNRTFRYLGQPRYPEGIDGSPPGQFSQLNDGGADPTTGLQVGPRLPASAYQSAVGYDAFNPGTNFRDPTNPDHQNGVVFFPGSAPLYRGTALIGGFGVSGDGVDQDDVTTAAGADQFGVPPSIPRADQVISRGVRLPYQKFNRNPEA
jgi:uncharacterized protein GlcG (DUF336 family)